MPNQAYYASLRASLSNERLGKYKQDGDRSDAEALGRYFFNIMLCESLYPCLQGLEVALRNSLDAAVKDRYGDRWLAPNSMYLTRWDQDHVLDAKERLDEEKRGKSWGHPDLVARMSFGFWVGLLSKNYDATTRYCKTPFWPHLLRPAFPHIPKHERSRANIEGFLTITRRLRNRVFHHEPIWHYGNLVDQHDAILEAIGWMNPDLAKTIRVFDRFREVSSAGIESCLNKVRTVLQPEE